MFLSYRRGDAAGRAGRLHDSLVARLGPGNVFQDVGSVGPGARFDSAIHTALETSDATLVVIGPDWLSAADANGRSRLDDPDDWVRREITAALATGKPVVPVLVGGATLPSADLLPVPLAPLTSRQAVVLSDDEWHHDLDGLLARLDEVSPEAARRPRRVWIAVGGLAAAAIAIVGAVMAATGGLPAGSTGGELPACPANDSTWTALDVSASAAVVDKLDEPGGNVLRYAVQAARTTERDGVHRVVATVEVTNETPPVEGSTADNWYVSAADFERLVVGGAPGKTADCFGPAPTDLAILPGQRTSTEIGFTTPVDPAAGVTLETDSSLPLVVTPAGTGRFHWRLVVNQTDPSVNCTMTLTNTVTGGEIRTGDVNGSEAAYQIRGDPDQWEVTGPDPCLWSEEPGAGNAVLPFTRPAGYGDTDAFDVGGPVAVAIQDLAGRSACKVTLYGLADGQPLDQATLTSGSAASAELDPGDVTRVYLAVEYCSLRIWPAS